MVRQKHYCYIAVVKRERGVIVYQLQADMPIGGFATLGIIDDLLSKVHSYGWNQPTMIQKAAIPQALSGKDVVGIAETGSGKTAAFLIPIIQHWIKSGRPTGTALVLAPTRELAQQIAVEAERLGSASDCRSDPNNLRVACLIGGEDMVQQTLQLAWNRHHIIVATPGRLMDHLRQSEAFASQQLSKLHHIVFDEADRMLSLDFADDIDTLLQYFQAPTRLDGKRGKKRHSRKKGILLDPDRNVNPPNSGSHRMPMEKVRFPHPQTQLFSATMTKDLAKLRRAALASDAVVVTSKSEHLSVLGSDSQQAVTTKVLRPTGGNEEDGKNQLIASRSAVGFPAGLHQYYIPLCLTDKLVALDWLMEQGENLSAVLKLPVAEPPIPAAATASTCGGEVIQRTIVFCKRCQETRLLTSFLRERGHRAIGLTGRMKQVERRDALREFLCGKASILVATDVASRGLDIPNVTLVVNYSVPLSEKTYRHRVGRTARAGQTGVAVTLVTHDTGADFIDLETKLSPHLASSSDCSSANQKKGNQGMLRWPIPLPSKDAMLVRCRSVDEARSRAGKAIRAEDVERRRMLEVDSDSESFTGQSVNLSSDDEGEPGEANLAKKDDAAETSDDSEATVLSTNSVSRLQSGDLPLVTSGLDGIRAARAKMRKVSREKTARRRQKAEADDARRSAAAEGWGLQFTLDSIESVMQSGNAISEDAEEKEEHLRFAEPVKAKYLKVKGRKRHVRP